MGETLFFQVDPTAWQRMSWWARLRRRNHQARLIRTMRQDHHSTYHGGHSCSC